MAKIFAYKGYIGISGWADNCPESIGENEEITLKHLSPALMNNPLEEGQLGFVCKIDKCSFSQEAIDLLKQIKPSNDDIGDVDILSSKEGPMFCWLGGPMKILNLESEGSRNYNPSLLPEASEVEVPEAFKNHVDLLIIASRVTVNM